MRTHLIRNSLVRLVACAIVGLGFAQSASAGLIGTHRHTDEAARQHSVAQLHSLMARQDVAQQLVRLGVSPATLQARIANMTDAELLALESGLEKQLAGGDAVGIIGTVFLVLLILELVGVTDIFKAI